MTITNDGATILKLLEVEHPAAKVLCELAELQDKEVGDGTTSVVSYAHPHTQGRRDEVCTFVVFRDVKKMLIPVLVPCICSFSGCVAMLTGKSNSVKI